MTPTLCRMVLVTADPASNNGSDVAPAVITRVWGEHPAGGHTVNLQVLPDAASPRWATSVRLVDTEEQARALAPSTAAWWPPRTGGTVEAA
jgi:hypothetical protein